MLKQHNTQIASNQYESPLSYYDYRGFSEKSKIVP